MVYTKHHKWDVIILERYWMNLSEYEAKLATFTQQEQQEIKYIRMKEIVEGLRKLYSSLPEEYKTIIDKCYLSKREYMDLDDIADNLKISRTVLSRYHTALINQTAKSIGYL